MVAPHKKQQTGEAEVFCLPSPVCLHICTVNIKYLITMTEKIRNEVLKVRFA
jgi:hypothetical protein